jgi:hypothetical protein
MSYKGDFDACRHDRHCSDRALKADIGNHAIRPPVHGVGKRWAFSP